VRVALANEMSMLFVLDRVDATDPMRYPVVCILFFIVAYLHSTGGAYGRAALGNS
jgi:hypothetical protein